MNVTAADLWIRYEAMGGREGGRGMGKGRREMERDNVKRGGGRRRWEERDIGRKGYIRREEYGGRKREI